MSHDFGSFGSRDRRSAADGGSGIGFHELRQACEISTLREDLERLSHESAALRGHVEEAVEEIRDRFAALSAQEMTQASAMAPLLQFAVTTLLDIREQARRLNTRTGPVADDDRSAWLGAAEAPRLRPVAAPCAPAAPRPKDPPPAPPFVAAPPQPAAGAGPGPGVSREEVAPPPLPAAAAPVASWLASNAAPSPAPAPVPPRAPVARGTGPAPAGKSGIDWLSPAGR